MEKAEVIKIGGEQLVRLPKDFNVNDDKIVMRRLGKMIMLVPENDAWDVFLEGLNGFTDDFFPNGREPQNLKQEQNK